MGYIAKTSSSFPDSEKAVQRYQHIQKSDIPPNFSTCNKQQKPTETARPGY
jgi:hypothetical protein